MVLRWSVGRWWRCDLHDHGDGRERGWEHHGTGDIDQHDQVGEFIETNNGPITATTVIDVP